MTKRELEKMDYSAMSEKARSFLEGCDIFAIVSLFGHCANADEVEQAAEELADEIEQ